MENKARDIWNTLKRVDTGKVGKRQIDVEFELKNMSIYWNKSVKFIL